MAVSELIDEHISAAQCTKAIESLLKHSQAHQDKLAEHELLPGAEPHVWLVLAVKRMQPEKRLKPFKIPLAHPLIDPRTSGICLITKDPQREYKDLLAEKNIKFISRVVGIEKLKGKWKPFEARRMLLRENGLFLADERVVPLLPKLLGKAFFQAKKQPIPVCLTRKDLKSELERAVSSTYMHQNQGTCTSIKVGNLSQTSYQLLANLRIALPAIVKRIPGGWENVQAFHIKTNGSVALPIWSCKLEDAAEGRWEGLTTVEAGSDEEVEEPAESDEELAPAPIPEKKKGKKRTAEPVEETSVKPAKKVKSSTIVTSVVEETASILAPKTKKAKATAAETAVLATKVAKTKTTPSSSTSMPKIVEKTVVETTEIPPGKGKKTKVPETTTVTEVPANTPKPKKTAKSKSAVLIDPSSPPSKSSSKTVLAIPPSPAPTTEELKAKKAGQAGEKKKEKALSKGAKEGRKSAKADVLGRKK